MKRFVFISLVCGLIISMSACGGDENATSNSEPLISTAVSDSSSQSEPSEIENALELISQAKYKEAYNLLSSIKNNAEAAELLEKFQIKPSNIKITNADSTQNFEIIYNSFGTKMKETLNGNVILQNDFDVNGVLISSSETIGDVTIKSEYTYTNGVVSKVVEKKGDDLFCTIDYTYSSGRVSQEIQTFADGKILKTEYTYDSEGREISEKVISSEGAVKELKYEYNSNGKIAKVTVVDQKTETMEYTYDSNGNTTKVVYAENGTSVSVETNTFENGKPIKSETVYTNGTTKTCAYTYDSNGNMTKETITDSQGVVTLECSYDSNGNMVKQIRVFAPVGGTPETTVYEYSAFNIYYAGA